MFFKNINMGKSIHISMDSCHKNMILVLLDSECYFN
jgi:hypothetical protein